ncbi:ATP-binding cassette domain-containing protein [Vibrio breoganii]|uniref:ATP-binding cassette domain-containing protein n=1 Tax=Vibrio breoganii TaxID=553239 RepID=UPI000C839001|nr:ATP-binding cassette domain-containing protein [Vibrio breoganii]PML36384.1 ABC transporter ATP-binding protein [Vibrio breoganii]PMO75096.1 ABC transporter ATP-binding protein [Vibrio breoganii]PMO92042.1 ABC transporter ATP-binding protein [Vibrio breoganii]
MSLCLKNLTVRKLDGSVLFDSLNMTIDSGEVVSLMGPSGCGKSTLLDVIAGHLSEEFSYQGEVVLNERPLDSVPAHQRKVGILFQDDLLFPHLNIWENLAFALPNTVKGEHRKQQAIEALEQISLSQLAYSYPEQISGGQRARVSLTRMLLAQPEVALLDEPFSKLDKQLRSQFRDWVFEQLKVANVPALMVTHDEQDTPDNSRVLNWPWETSHA